MIDPQHPSVEPTAVDDVRRVREKISREYGGDLDRHVSETNRIAGELRAKLNVRLLREQGHEARKSGSRR